MYLVKVKYLFQFLLLLVFFGAFTQPVQAQLDSIHPGRLRGTVITESLGYGLTMGGLYQLWYKEEGLGSFHFFNDNADWLQMDKAGHATTAYYVGYAGLETLKWTGLERKKALWYGGTLGFVFLTSVEGLDGFAKEWGFSWGDALANASGTGLLIAQDLIWQEQRVMLKFSYHHTDFATYVPNLLGSSWNERLLKDYNGQTYWLSANLASFVGESKAIPSWLNVAVGYGATGMTSGSASDIREVIVDGTLQRFARRRQAYLSLDVDLTRIKSKHQWVRTALGTFGFLKMPFPALEWREGKGLSFHPIFF